MDPSETKTLKHKVESLPIRGFRVDVVEGPDAGKGAAAKDDSFSIGTAEDNDLVLKDQTVSRYHGELQCQADRILAIDHGSTNGTVAGGVRIERGFVPELRCSIAMAGESPSIKSTSGFSIWSRNCRA